MENMLLVAVSYAVSIKGVSESRSFAIVQPEVIMVQEHWLTTDNLVKLNSLSDDYFVFGSSAMNDCINTGPLVARPFGGTAFIINKKCRPNSL